MEEFGYTIRDKKVETWSRPFYAQNNPAAIRVFSELVNAGDNNVSKYPEDFALWTTCKFDAATGKTTAVEEVEICRALDVVQASGFAVPEMEKSNAS